MPEYFFHVCLDTGFAPLHGADINTPKRRTNIFATPPILESQKFNTGYRQNTGDKSDPTALHAASSDDWRAGRIVVQSVDMVSAQAGSGGQAQIIQSTNTNSRPHANEAGIRSNSASPAPSSTTLSLRQRFANSPGNAATKARFEPTDVHEANVGWGVVRVFRDIDETPGLYNVDVSHAPSKHISSSLNDLALSTPAASAASGSAAASSSRDRHVNGQHNVSNSQSSQPVKDEDCTTLAILAVPSYMSPADFLGWVGPQARAEVSHFRLIKTERANRYMALMRFRSGRRAREWRREWNGATFDAAEPETAQVVFVKSITFANEQSTQGSFPVIDDPFTKGKISTSSSPQSMTPSTLQSKPLAPPTPNLEEMPTCPVCLERMDESTGLLTIQCQHVFHCTCLHKWRGSGCPVCRFTHSDVPSRTMSSADPTMSSSDARPNECSICHSDTNLWICLICGNIGCGRYDAAHAFMHWTHSGHAFSMDMSTQRIWDYMSDAYVHRIVQNKLDGKLSEAPEGDEEQTGADIDGDGYVPRVKSDAIGREYTALLSSQLESQRAYYEEKVSMAADKASQAGLAATQAAEAASRALDELARLQESHRVLAEEMVPALERDRDRAARKMEKAQEMARKFEREWREEKTVTEGLMERVKKLDEQVAGVGKLKEEVAELQEMNRDLQFFISSQEKVKELGEEVQEGSVSLPEEKKAKNRKKRGKGKQTQNGTNQEAGPS